MATSSIDSINIKPRRQENLSQTDWYPDTKSYIVDEITLLDIRLKGLFHERLELEKRQGQGATNGVYISAEEVQSILSAPKMVQSQITHEFLNLENQQHLKIQKKLQQTIAHGIELPITRVQKVFGLSADEVAILIMALAPEIDKRYHTVYAYLNDDLTKKMPSVGVALELLGRQIAHHAAGLCNFAPQAPLCKNELIFLINDTNTSTPSNRFFGITERIARFLLGDIRFSDETTHLQICYPVSQVTPVLHTAPIEFIVKNISNLHLTTSARPVFWLYGKADQDKYALIRFIAQQFNATVITVDCAEIWMSPDFDRILRCCFREGALTGAIVEIRGGEHLYAPDEQSIAKRQVLLRMLRNASGVTIITAESLWMPVDTIDELAWLPVEIKQPDFTQRLAVISALPQASALSEDDKVHIASRFKGCETQIRSSLAGAQQLAGKNQVDRSILHSVCRMQTGRQLGVLAKKIEPRYAWTDIVLSDDRTAQLREIADHIQYRHQVYYSWGFGTRLANGRGVNILFSGPSGTGKTMAADVIAHELCLDLYKIDLSMIVSKYIGETEKNLSAIFREAEGGNCILFFDEADALFGKRSEVKDSHDRYSNIEIGYLLQKMEEHDGVVILATNLSKNIDDAFARRMNFSIEFPFPGAPQRRRIWEGMFPAQAPQSADIDLDFLADKIKVAGGSIRNIVLTSAFFAARDNTQIGLEHVLRAIVREYQKLGKTCVPDDFKPYSHLVTNG